MITKRVKSLIINPSGGVSKTIKAQYWKNSLANFIRQDGTAATGIMEVHGKDWSETQRDSVIQAQRTR